MMERKTEKQRSECPISCSLDIWGDKWSLLILRDLIIYQKTSYGEFLKSPEKIATNILSARLLKLEENGLIRKIEKPGTKERVIYQLTPMGLELVPVLMEIYIWSGKYLPHTKAHQEFIREYSESRDTYVKKLYDDLAVSEPD